MYFLIKWCQYYKPQNTVKLQKKWLFCNRLDGLVTRKMLIYVTNATYHCKITE